MFTAVAHKNLADAEGYFDEHFSQNDYYAAGEIRPGQWIGVGAERLGLSGGQNVSRQQFYALCENRNPKTDERLTQRQQKEDKRRVFFDFTCSAPKAVSVLAVTFGGGGSCPAHPPPKIHPEYFETWSSLPKTVPPTTFAGQRHQTNP